MVRGEDFSDKIFQNPGGYFPLRVREPQLKISKIACIDNTKSITTHLWALCRDLGGADLGLPLEVVGFLSRGLSVGLSSQSEKVQPERPPIIDRFQLLSLTFTSAASGVSSGQL